jgi:hypothetical protein
VKHLDQHTQTCNVLIRAVNEASNQDKTLKSMTNAKIIKEKLKKTSKTNSK